MPDTSATVRIPRRGTKGTRMPGGKFLMRLFKPLLDRQVTRIARSTGPEPAITLAKLGRAMGVRLAFVDTKRKRIVAA